MRVKCIGNTGKFLSQFNYTVPGRDFPGRFNGTEEAHYNLEIGKEYVVMGIVYFDTFISYLVDERLLISFDPAQLFEILDDKINPSWRFRLINKREKSYPQIMGVLGYPELIEDKDHFEKLVLRHKGAVDDYFRRKREELIFELERRVMEVFLEAEDDATKKLKNQYKIARTFRKKEGKDLSVFFDVPPIEQYRLGNASFILDKVQAKLSSLEKEVGFLLEIKNGFLSSLTGYTYNQVWPEEFEVLSILKESK